MSKESGGQDKKKEKEKNATQKNPALEDYFKNMEKKQTMTMNNPRLQKQLDENRERRAIMKA